MQTKTYKWHRVALSLAELEFTNAMAAVVVDGSVLLVCKGSQGYYACARKCPHAGVLLDGGYIDAHDNIVCPSHRYKFSLKNGRNVTGEGYFLKTFPVKVDELGVFVGIEVKTSWW
jgi:nitrite reductase/ring-hydroxylating ferredoxin subunit